MTRTESARLKSYGEAYAQKKLELHLAKEMSTIAEKRFLDYLQEIADRDDPPPDPAPPVEPIIDYLEKVDDYKFPVDVMVDGKG
jgi:hypothetical protein